MSERRERIREALRVLIDTDLPWVHDDYEPNCGECWECIAGILGVARAMHKSGLMASDALDVEDRLVWLNSALAEAQGHVRTLVNGWGAQPTASTGDDERAHWDYDFNAAIERAARSVVNPLSLGSGDTPD